MKIKGTQKTEIEVDKTEIAYAIMDIVFETMGYVQDDAGCDWFTRDGNTYIAEEDWIVCTDPRVASLIDAANIIRYGKKLELEKK